jgi:hypothetical protein
MIQERVRTWEPLLDAKRGEEMAALIREREKLDGEKARL